MCKNLRFCFELLQQHDSNKLLLEWYVITYNADPKPGYDNARYYAIQIAASYFLDEVCGASVSVVRSCNCEYAAISRHVSETVQASAKVTI